MTVLQRLFKHDSCRYRCEYHGDHLEVCGLFCFLLWHYEVKCDASATQTEPIVRKQTLEEKVDDIGRLIRGIHTKMFCTLERTSQPHKVSTPPCGCPPQLPCEGCKPVEKAAKELARELNTHYRKHFLGDFNELSEDAQSVHIDVTTEIILSYMKE